MKDPGSRIAYLILAHHQPRHLSRLLDALNCRGIAFFVHIDRKSNLDDFASLADLPNVRLEQEWEHVNWGGFSIVKTTLRLLRTAPMPTRKILIISSS